MKEASAKWLFRKANCFEPSIRQLYHSGLSPFRDPLQQYHRHRMVKSNGISNNHSRYYTGTSFHVPSAYRIYNKNSTYRNEKSATVRGKNPYMNNNKKDSSSPTTKEVRKYPSPLQDDIRNLGRLENEAKSILKLYVAAFNTHSTVVQDEDGESVSTTTISISPLKDHHDAPKCPNVHLLQSASTTATDTTLPSLRMNTYETLTSEQLHTLSVSLRQSEDKYRHLCVKIRQLVAGWASLRPTSTTDLSKKYHKFHNLSELFQHYILEGEIIHHGESLDHDLKKKNTSNSTLVPSSSSSSYTTDHTNDDMQFINPTKRAEEYILLLDELRIHRTSMIQLAFAEYYNYYPNIGDVQSLDNASATMTSVSPKDTSSFSSKGIMKWIKTLFISSSSKVYQYPTPTTLDVSLNSTSAEDPTTRILANLLQLKAHESSNFTSTTRLYKEIMKSHIYWYNLVAHEMGNRTDYSTNSMGDDNDVAEEEEMKDAKNRKTLEEDKINRTMAAQNQILANELDRLFESMKHIYHGKNNKNVLPDRDMYHIIMKQHARLGTYSAALRVLELLQELKETATILNNNPSNHIIMDFKENEAALTGGNTIRKIRHGKNSLDKTQDSTIEIHPLDAYKPTLSSYCIALRACRNFVACPPMDKIERKLKIVDQAINLLLESETIGSAKVWIEGEDITGNEADSDMAPSLGSVVVEPLDPTWSARIITLSILNLAGHKVIPDLCSRIDALMIKFIGEKAFLKLVGEDGSVSLSDFKIDLAICHLMIEIYNRKKDKRYANRAKAVLRFMEAMVNNSKWNSNDVFPCTNTYNSVIKCMHLERTLENAEAASDLLNSMVRRQFSMPNRTTFNGVLSLWSCSDSAEAGEKASAILARMELHDMLQAESTIRPTVRSYELALKCWSLAALKGYPSAAKRAHGILKSMEAQCSTVSFEAPLVESRIRQKSMQPYNNELRPEVSVYCNVIYAASKTTSEGDKAEALQLAFDVYNRLLDRKLLPTKMMFLNLINCCHLVPVTRLEQRKLLLNRIIESMSADLRSDKDISQAMRVLHY